ncbi:MAG: nuclear transport factor 2 family protein [Bacteroidales bacterium]|nr:nuclear transport factor 2 family protein [Bacteroidales bacterium]MCF8398459.1 nuclear transport factor 2 family protein [Bacteroidales bacterium]
MKKAILAIFVLIAMVSCNGPGSEEKKEATASKITEKVDGRMLEKKIWRDFNKRDMDAISSKISDAFQSVHQDGARDKQQELKLLRNLDLGQYKLSDFKVTQQGNVVVVTYMISAIETIDGKILSKKPAPRMSVWIKDDTSWKWIGHANLKPQDEQAQY